MNFLRESYLCRLFLFLFFVSLHVDLSLANTDREKGLPFTQNFSHQDYKGWAQNWSVTQDNSGVIIFANSAGIISFDGARFNTILHPDLHMPRSIGKDVSGNIFVGFFGGIGFLSPDSVNSYSLVELNQFLPDTLSEFYDVWYTQATPEGVYFMTENYLFRWDYDPDNPINGQFKIWSFDEKDPLQCFCYINDHTYFHQVGKGLFEIEDDDILPVSQSHLARKISVNDIFMMGEKTILSGTDGFYSLNEGRLRKYNKEISSFAEEYDGRYVTALGRDRFALTTDHNGVAVFNEAGNVEQVINRKAGIKDNLILGKSFLDVDGGLWIPQDYGLSRVEIMSPLSYLDEGQGLGGYAFRIKRFNGDLYVGTSQGLYVLEKGNRFDLPYFEKIDGIESHCWALHVIEDKLLVCSNDNLYEINGRSKEVKIVDNLIGQSITQYYNRIFVGTWYDGVHVFDIVNGELVKKGKVEGFTGPAQDLVIQNDRYLWFSNDEVLIKMDVEGWDGGGSINAVQYDMSDGLPSLSYFEPFILKGELYAGGNRNLYKYDQESDRFILDEVINEKLGTRNALSSVYRISKEGDIWFQKNNRQSTQAKCLSDNDYKLRYPFSGSIINGCYDFYIDEANHLVWAASYEGKIIRYDIKNPGWLKPSKSARIARVILNGDSLIYGGVNTGARTTPLLSSSQNNLRFEYSLPDFVSYKNNKYRFRLIGLNEKWSEWSEEDYRDFTSLSAGKYRFEVEGKDISGKISQKGEYGFVVQPAWYSSVYAVVIYILLGVVVYYLIVKIRVARLNRERETLRKLVEEKTNEALDQFERAKQAEIISKQLKIANQLSATIAHEFNNPLAIIKGNVELMQLEKDDHQNFNDRVKRVDTQIKRMTDLVNKLLELRELKEVDYAAGVKILDIHPPGASSLEKSKQETIYQREKNERFV